MVDRNRNIIFAGMGIAGVAVAAGVVGYEMGNNKSNAENNPNKKIVSLKTPAFGTFPVITQELNLNNFRSGANSESQVWANIIANLKTDFAQKDNLQGSNSMLTTLSNEPQSKNPIVWGDFGTDPKTEPGLWQTPDDWDNFKDLYQLDGNSNVNSLFRTNSNGVDTIGIYGRADDRDAIAYYLAAALVAHANGQDFGNTTLADLKSGKYPAQFDQQIVTTQNQILTKIQGYFLAVSGEELQRRQEGSDASSQIPSKFRKSDQFVSRDVYMANADAREDQKQSERCVTHRDAASQTFTSSNSGTEGTLVTISFDPQSGSWGVRAVTNRNYETSQMNSAGDASGEQELPGCNQVQIAPTKLMIQSGVTPLPPQQGGNPPENHNNPPAPPQKGPDPFNNGQNNTSDMANRDNRGTGGGASNADQGVNPSSLSQTGSNEP